MEINGIHIQPAFATHDFDKYTELLKEQYTIIGFIHKKADQWYVFSTDDINSEIGFYDESTCSYSTIVNDPCLGFNTNYLISGKSKYNYDCSETLYWADSGLNPRRYLNLSHVPYVNQGTVCDPDYTPALDCNKLLITLSHHTSGPKIYISRLCQ